MDNNSTSNEPNNILLDDKLQFGYCGGDAKDDLQSHFKIQEKGLTRGSKRMQLIRRHANLLHLDLANRFLRKTSHVTQNSNWDCGIACVAMCLEKEQKSQLFARLNYFCYDEQVGFGTSTWTIDLCYLLAYFRLEHKMFTTSMGVNPALGRENFYRPIIDRDTERIQKRFFDRKKNGVNVVERSLSLANMLYLISHSGPLIVLVNANLLFCNECSWRVQKFLSQFCLTKYQGHYVLVIGYDIPQCLIYYRNPGLPDRICSASFEEFDLARQSFGTDEDIIVVKQ